MNARFQKIFWCIEIICMWAFSLPSFPNTHNPVYNPTNSTVSPSPQLISFVILSKGWGMNNSMGIIRKK